VDEQAEDEHDLASANAEGHAASLAAGNNRGGYM